MQSIREKSEKMCKKSGKCAKKTAGKILKQKVESVFNQQIFLNMFHESENFQFKSELILSDSIQKTPKIIKIVQYFLFRKVVSISGSVRPTSDFFRPFLICLLSH